MLAARKVDVLVAMGTPATMAAKHATVTIPIVFGLVGDGVGAGVVTSLARPGGNVTRRARARGDSRGRQTSQK
jgi:ABC-type uncharacterized transport system substrate-binding protein